MDLFLTAVIGDAAGGFCESTANIWQIVGYVLLVFKIVIPLILIILGALDLGKAVISSKEEDTTKAIGRLVKRVVAAVIIFFIPTIIGFVFTIVGNWNTEAKNDYDVCRKCITSPGGECKDKAAVLWT